MTAHRFLADVPRPAPASAVSSVWTLAWRAMLKIKHVPFQLFDVTVTPIMFTLLFTFIFGGALAGSPREYVQYLLPGVLVQTVVFITVYTGVGLNTDIHKDCTTASARYRCGSRPPCSVRSSATCSATPWRQSSF